MGDGSQAIPKEGKGGQMMTALHAFLIVISLVTAIQAQAKQPGDPLPPDERYLLLKGYNEQAVLDQETGLIWERDPNQNGTLAWAQARQVCLNKRVANKKGWRLPTITELTSVWDPFIVQQASPFI